MSSPILDLLFLTFCFFFSKSLYWEGEREESWREEVEEEIGRRRKGEKKWKGGKEGRSGKGKKKGDEMEGGEEGRRGEWEGFHATWPVCKPKDLCWTNHTFSSAFSSMFIGRMFMLLLTVSYTQTNSQQISTLVCCLLRLTPAMIITLIKMFYCSTTHLQFTIHVATKAKCIDSRSSLLPGQHCHQSWVNPFLFNLTSIFHIPHFRSLTGPSQLLVMHPDTKYLIVKTRTGNLTL